MFMNIMNPMDMEELLSYTPDQLNKVALRQFNRRELLRGLEKERKRIAEGTQVAVLKKGRKRIAGGTQVDVRKFLRTVKFSDEVCLLHFRLCNRTN